MKKKFLAAILLILSFYLFGEKYQINKVNYNIEGCGWRIFGKTQAYAVDLNVPVDKTRIFESEQELMLYLQDYEQRLINTRAFDTINIQHNIAVKENDISYVSLSVSLKDTFHFLALPYPKYDSNQGFNFKLKEKDTNFLGTLNILSSDLYLLLASKESDNKENQIGFNFDFDYPFPLYKLNAQWTNTHSFYYVFGESMPEWNFKTGLDFKLPEEKYTLEWIFNQSFINNLDYLSYNDNLYFVEEAEFLSSINLVELRNNTVIYYSPYVDSIFYWDKNGINKENTDLSGLRITAGHSLSNSHINWNNNFRNGYSLSFTNSYSYNFKQNTFLPSVSITAVYYKTIPLFNFENKGWTFLNYFGTNVRSYAFFNFDKTQNYFNSASGTSIGSYLRGIRDEQYYSDNSLSYLCRTNGAILLNLDFPFQIIHTCFSHKLFNFDLQLSPFFDAALIQNKYYKTNFNLKNGLYTAGLEVLVFPEKLKSIIVRGSCGFDLRRLLKIHTEDLSENVSPWEITFGVGLFY